MDQIGVGNSVVAHLREAWVKGGADTHSRFGAVERALREGIARSERLSPIAPSRRTTEARPATTTRTVVTEADAERVIARAFGRGTK